MLNPIQRLSVSCIVAIAASLYGAPGHGQVARGVAVDSISGSPVVGGIVRAVGSEGETIYATMTDVEGRWTMAFPAGDQPVLLELRRLGYANQSFRMPAKWVGDDLITLRARADPVILIGIEVTGEPQCGPDLVNAAGVYAIWSEVRKALELSETGSRENVEGYEIERSFRSLEVETDRVLADSVAYQIVAVSNPYRTLSVEQMSADGWVHQQRDGKVFFAPDAALLISDAFERQHCFTAMTSPDSVVLSFRPHEDRARLPDIEGEVILAGDPLDLTELTFRYVGRPVASPRGVQPHGEVSFFTAPNGLRVVRDWWIRVPIERFGLRGFIGRRLSHIMEEGGSVLRVLVRPDDGTIPGDWHFLKRS